MNKMKTIKGNLTLKEHITIDGDLKVDGNIVCEGRRWDINARNIKARNINAGDINARNINAGDINAKNINAVDIKYYAVCFAYKNIKCNSIEGKREPCKEPFVLDGEIIIKKKAQEKDENTPK